MESRIRRLEQSRRHRSLTELRELPLSELRYASDDELAMLIRNDPDAVATDIDERELEAISGQLR